MAQKIEVKNDILKSRVYYLTSDYYTRNASRGSHKGMDLVGGIKQDDIIAIADGVVTYVGYDKSGGNWVSIKTNGIEHRYFHIADGTIRVKKNEQVKKGQVIATVGMTGNATGYHVHFAIYKNGSYVDPLPYLMNDKPFDVPETTEAFTKFVKDLQTVFKINVDGIPGAITLNKTITVSRKQNNRHEVVKILQEYLQSLGYDLGKYGIDGVFGPDMERIIKEYQKNVVGLKENYIDGVITARRYTWQKLLKLA